MKWLIILILILFVFVLIFVRYRKQLLMGMQLYKMYRQMRSVGKPIEIKQEKRDTLNDVPLVRCERCGKWISQTSALKFRSKTFYCSSACMERAAKLQSLVD